MLSEIRNFVYRTAKRKIFCFVRNGARNYDIARCSFVLGAYCQIVGKGRLSSDESKKNVQNCLNHYLELYGPNVATVALIDALADNQKSKFD